MLESFPVKPVAFGITFVMGIHYVFLAPCADGKECPKSKAVPISFYASAGTANTTITMDQAVYVPNLLIGTDYNVTPLKKVAWTQS